MRVRGETRYGNRELPRAKRKAQRAAQRYARRNGITQPTTGIRLAPGVNYGRGTAQQ